MSILFACFNVSLRTQSNPHCTHQGLVSVHAAKTEKNFVTTISGSACLCCRTVSGPIFITTLWRCIHQVVQSVLKQSSRYTSVPLLPNKLMSALVSSSRHYQTVCKVQWSTWFCCLNSSLFSDCDYTLSSTSKRTITMPTILMIAKQPCSSHPMTALTRIQSHFVERYATIWRQNIFFLWKLRGETSIVLSHVTDLFLILLMPCASGGNTTHNTLPVILI